MRVLVTGCSGYLGARLLARLQRDPDVDEILGIDERLPQEYHPKLTLYQQSVTQPYERYFEGVDAAIHLAFAFAPMRDHRWGERVNLEGSDRFLRGVSEHGVSEAVLVSSATVYGARPDNPVPFTEFSPLRGDPNFYESRDKTRVEALCASYQTAGVNLKIARPCVVTGPHAQHFWMRYLTRQHVPIVQGCDPPMQFVHEDDAAAALHGLLKGGGPGVYNIAPEGNLYLSNVIERLGGTAVAIPRWMLSGTVDTMWRYNLGHLRDMPPGMIPYICYPWVIDGSKLVREVGVTPQYDSYQAIESFRVARGLESR